MALIKCPDCSTEVSDAAPACPKCARPISQRLSVAAPPSPQAEPPKKGGISILRVIVLLVVVLGLGAGVLVVLNVRYYGPQSVSQIKEEVAKQAGIKTEKAAQDDVVEIQKQRSREANEAVSAANEAAKKFYSRLTDSSYPEAADLSDAVRKATDAVRIARQRIGAYEKYCEKNLDTLKQRGFTNESRDSVVRAAAGFGSLEAALGRTQVREVTCVADRKWESAGVDVQTSDSVVVWAKGSWQAGPNWKECGPDGTDETSILGDYHVFRGVKLMTLVGRVSSQAQENTCYTLGKFGRFAAPSGGTIQLRCNDSDPSNNSGGLAVLIVATPQLQR